VKKLLSLVRRSHRPDVEALSALLDGCLEEAEARALHAHVASCDACTRELDGLREVRSMVSALGTVAVPRSFRLRQADVEASAPGARVARAGGAPASRFGGAGVLAFAPTVSAVAVVLLGAVVWADIATRNGDDAAGGFGLESATAPERSSDDMYDGAGGEDTQAAAPGPDAPAGGEADEDATAGGPPAEIRAAESATAEARDAGALASRFDEEDGGGTRFGYLALEIALGTVAFVAAGAFIWSRWGKREVA